MRLPLAIALACAMFCASGGVAQSEGTAAAGRRMQARIDAPDTVAMRLELCESGPRDTIITITNSGTSDLMITDVTLERDTSFHFLSPPVLPMYITPGSSMPIGIRFDPAVAGDAAGDLVVRSNAINGSPLMIRLQGRRESASLRALSLYFGAVPSTGFPATKSFPVNNDGTVAVTLTAATFGSNPPFTVLAGVPATIQPNGTGFITVRFDDPGPDSYFSDTLTITHAPTCEALRILVAGSKYSRPTVDWPDEVRWPDQVCMPSPRDTSITIVNTGDFDLYLTSASHAGSAAFSLLSTLPRRIPIGGRDTISVRFAPSGFGPASATFSIANNSSNAPALAIAVSGWVLRAALAPVTVEFGSVPQSTLPAMRRFGLHNAGDAPITVDSLRFSVPSPFRVAAGLPATIAPGDSAAIDLQFLDPGADLMVKDTAIMFGTPACALVRVAVSGTRLSRPRIDGPASIILRAPQCDPAHRDTTVTIANNGGKVLRVDLVTLTGSPQLSLVAAPVGSFDLAPGSGRPLTIRYDASTAGPVSATLTVVSDAENAPIYSVPVFGSRDSLALDGTALDMGLQRPVQLPLVRSVMLDNTGDVDVTATSLMLSDGSVFRIVSTAPIVVPAGMQRPVFVEMRDPGYNGAFGDTLLVRSTPSCSALRVPLRGERLAMPGIDAPALVDLPARFCDTTSADTLVVVTNSGDLPLVFAGGTFSGVQDLELLFLSAPRTLAPGDTIQALVRSAPRVPGLHSATLDLRFGERGDTLVQVPFFLRYDVGMLDAAVADVDTLFTGEAATLHVVPVRNTGTVPVTIDALAGAADFSVVAGLPATIAPGDTAFITLQFAAGTGDTVLAASLVLTASPLCTPVLIEVRGVRVEAVLHMVVPELRASVGDIVDLPISITQARHLAEAGVGTLDIALRIRSNILAPIAAPPRVSSGGWDRYQLRVVLPQSDSTSWGLRFQAMLGLDSTTIIAFDSLVIRTPRNVLASWRDGRFTLDDICREGDTRFFDGSATLAITGVHPNPFNPRTIVDLQLLESAPTRIILVDAAGREVLFLHEGWMEAGAHRISVDASALPSGSYRFVLLTPSGAISRPLHLLR